MTHTYTGYLIDPKAETIEEVEVEPGIDFIYDLIDCDRFTTGHMREGDAVYVDDEGLLNGTGRAEGFFKLEDYHSPLAGKGLITGVNGAGESTSPAFGLEYYQKQLAFFSPIEIALMYA